MVSNPSSVYSHPKDPVLDIQRLGNVAREKVPQLPSSMVGGGKVSICWSLGVRGRHNHYVLNADIEGLLVGSATI